MRQPLGAVNASADARVEVVFARGLRVFLPGPRSPVARRSFSLHLAERASTVPTGQWFCEPCRGVRI